MLKKIKDFLRKIFTFTYGNPEEMNAGWQKLEEPKRKKLEKIIDSMELNFKIFKWMSYIAATALIISLLDPAIWVMKAGMLFEFTGAVPLGISLFRLYKGVKILENNC